MSRLLKLINFNLKDDHKSWVSIQERFSTDDYLEFESNKNTKEINKQIRNDRNVLLIFKIESKVELMQIAAIMRNHLDLINQGVFKTICLLGVNSEKVERLLYKYGCSEVVNINVSTKTLLIKTELAIKTIKRNNQQNSQYMTVAHKKIQAEESENDHVLTFDKLIEDEDDHLILDSLSDDDFDSEKVYNFNIQNNKESEPKLVDYFNENGQLSQMNLESGSLDLSVNGIQNLNFCSFENFEESSMVLGVDKDYQNEFNQDISVFVKFIYNKCRIEIELTGKVIAVEYLDGQKKNLIVDFGKNEFEKYNYFMELYQKRQKNINDFIALARGTNS